MVRRFLRLGSRGLPVLLIGATTTAVAAAAVTFAITRPSPGRLLTRLVDLQVFAVVQNAVHAKDPSCAPKAISVTHGTPRLKINDGTPSRLMLSTLPALRRGETGVDRHAFHSRWLSDLPLAPGGAVYVNDIRRVRTVDGISFYFVPVSHLGTPPLPRAQANRCYQLKVTALQAELRTVSAAGRAATRRYGDAAYALARYNAETSRVIPNAVFLMARTASGGSFGGAGESPSTIRRTGTLERVGISPGRTVLYGIVPAGVATVSLRFPATRYEKHRLGALTVTGKVVNNTFVIPARVPSEGWREPGSVIWRSGSGKLIKTVKRPAT